MTDADKADETTTTSPTSAEKPADKPAQQSAEKPADKRAEKPARTGPGPLRTGLDAVRSRLASLVWLVAVVAALFLAVGALLIALRMNQDNAIVAFVLDVARALDLGVFKDFTGKDAAVKEALTNWGIAAVIYLVAGKVLDRVIRP